MSHMRSRKGHKVVPVPFDPSAPTLGTCTWQRSELIFLNCHLVGEVFGEGRQRASLASVHMYAAIWLLRKDERGIR